MKIRRTGSMPYEEFPVGREPASRAPRAERARPSVPLPLEQIGSPGRLGRGRAAPLAGLALLAVVVVVAGFGVAGRLMPQPSPTPPPAAAPPPIDTFERLGAEEAYAVAGHYLYTTRDGGSTWERGVLPVPGENPPSAGTDAGQQQPIDVPYAASFVDPDHGWFAVAPGPRRTDAAAADYAVAVLATSDAGRTWHSGMAPGVKGMAMDLRFVDRRHGWLNVYQLSGETKSFRTIDSGATWQEIAPPPLGEFRIFPTYTSPTEGWVVVPDSPAAAGPDAGFLTVLHSTDAGSTWSVSSLRPGAAVVSHVTVAGTPRRVGATIELPVVLYAEPSTAVAPENPGRLEPPLVTGSALPTNAPTGASDAGSLPWYQVVTFVSEDDGGSWRVEHVVDAPRERDTRSWGPSVVPIAGGSGESVVYLQGAASQEPVVASFDQGATWRTVDTSTFDGHVVRASWASPTDVWVRVMFDERDETRLYASHDGGASWTPILGAPGLRGTPGTTPATPGPNGSAGQASSIVDSLGILPGGGVWQQRDGTLWLQAGIAAGSSPVALPFVPDAISVASADRIAIAHQIATSAGPSGSGEVPEVEVAATSDGGRTWSSATLGVPGAPMSSGFRLTVNTSADGEIGLFVDSQFVAPSECVRYRSIAGGTVWTGAARTPCLQQRGFASPSLGFGIYNGFRADLSAFAITRDGGETWTMQSTTDPEAFGGSFAVQFVEDGPGDRLLAAVSAYTATPQGGVEPGVRILESTDGGVTWNLRSFVGGESASRIGPKHWLVFQPPDADGMTSTALETTDAGASWTPLRITGLPAFTTIRWLDDHTGFAVAPDPAAAGSDAVFATSDGGRSWSKLPDPPGVP